MPVLPKFFVAAAMFAAVVTVPGVSEAAPAPPEGPPGSYIVVLRDGSDPRQVADDHNRRFNAELSHVYSAALNGYAARIPQTRLADLRADPRVSYVEADGTATTSAQTIPWGINRIDADISSTLAGNGTGSVTGVNAYVIDTGISTTPTSTSSATATGPATARTTTATATAPTSPARSEPKTTPAQSSAPPLACASPD